MKTCTCCGVEKPFSEYTKQKAGRDGLRPRCKPCVAIESAAYRIRARPQRLAYNREYHVKNREKRLAYNNAWNKAHRANTDAATRRWRARNPEEVKAQKTAWRLANPDKVRAHKQAEYDRNKEKIIARVRVWRQENPDKHRAQSLKRRSVQRNAAGVEYTTAAHITARFDLYGGKCFYCGEVATSVDHRIPLARGGSHWPSNLVPACRSCNCRKHAKHPLHDRLVAA